MMDTSLLLAMLQNAAMLLVLVVLYAISSRPFATDTWLGPKGSLRAQLASGILLGAMGVLIIATPLRYDESIILDTRSVLVSLAALYFGWIPAVLVMTLTALYRAYVGGAAVTGVLVILSSGACGLLWRHYCRARLERVGTAELLGLGLCVHGLVMLLMYTLPIADPRAVMGDIVLPFMFLFPLLTVLIGKLLSHFLRTELLAQAALESTQRLSLAMEVSRMELFELDLQSGEIRSLSRELSETRYPDRRYISSLGDLLSELHPEDVAEVQSHLREVQTGKLREWHGDFRQHTHGGGWAWIHVAGRLVAHDAQGKPKTFLGTYMDVTARKRADDQMWQQANIDKVTGLPNRSLFLERLGIETRRAAGAGSRLAVLYLDLDHFKEVNDSLGHDAGDRLLQLVATRLRGLEGEYSLLARIGGDEFIYILSDLPHIGMASEMADKVLLLLAEPFTLGEKPLYVGASLGISVYPDDGASGEILLRSADQAMYAAKHDGRNRARFFTPSMQDSVDRKARLVADMREALRSGNFAVHYQPIVAPGSDAAVKVEALLRWQHAELGWISPETFIPVAEESGLIIALGNFVLHQVVQDMRVLDATCPWLQFSLNKSPLQFSSDDDVWLEQLAARPDIAERLTVEITEGLLLDERPSVQQHLRRLQQAGVRLAIDDFGTGYSSLAYLKRFHVAFLKIDRSFIQNLEAGNEDDSLCQAMITMAHRLGIEVIAEGVESEQQRELLRAAGCDLIQGFLVSPPVPVDSLVEFLTERR